MPHTPGAQANIPQQDGGIPLVPNAGFEPMAQDAVSAIVVQGPDGLSHVVPLDVNGQRMSPEQAKQLFQQGQLQSVGSFDRAEQAQSSIEARSDAFIKPEP